MGCSSQYSALIPLLMRDALVTARRLTQQLEEILRKCRELRACGALPPAVTYETLTLIEAAFVEQLPIARDAAGRGARSPVGSVGACMRCAWRRAAGAALRHQRQLRMLLLAAQAEYVRASVTVKWTRAAHARRVVVHSLMLLALFQVERAVVRFAPAHEAAFPTLIEAAKMGLRSTTDGGERFADITSGEELGSVAMAEARACVCAFFHELEVRIINLVRGGIVPGGIVALRTIPSRVSQQN